MNTRIKLTTAADFPASVIAEAVKGHWPYIAKFGSVFVLEMNNVDPVRAALEQNVSVDVFATADLVRHL